MAELLKNIYNFNFFDQYCTALAAVLTSFEKTTFLSKVQIEEWENFELKQRMNHLCIITNEFLPKDFKEKTNTILKIIDSLRMLGVKDQNLEYIFLADIVSTHGLAYFDISIRAIEKITEFVSFEFAGRTFFIRYPDKMMAQMKIWAKHDHPNIRRYASEGCRPRLPWGLQLKQFVIDPAPIIPILEILKDDPSLYVQKSVANNLNDISKDHPELVIELIKKWKGKTKNTDWVIKQGSRTLLKKGNAEVLHLFGTSPSFAFNLSSFDIDRNQLKLGEIIEISFSITNESDKDALFRFEYLIYFIKSNGKLSKKVFKIAEKLLNPKVKYTFSKKHKFINLSTRKHYAGTHKISILVNGLESELIDFELRL